MSEPLYQKLVSMLLGLALLILAIFASAVLFLFVFIAQIQGALYAALGVLVLSCLFGARYFLQVKHFKEDMHLYIPGSGIEQTREPLINTSEPKEPRDRALKAVFYYRAGVPFKDIAERLGLPIHATAGKREVLKGLDILLKEHEIRKEVEAC
jgi:hypothetical protein